VPERASPGAPDKASARPLDGSHAARYRRVEMKFHATVVFEFNAPDVGEAGRRLNELVERAAEHQLETKSLELSTPPGTVVTLPPVTPART